MEGVWRRLRISHCVTCAHASMHQEGSICLAGAEPYSWAFSYMARPLAIQVGSLFCSSQAREEYSEV